MDFSYSPRTREYLQQVKSFMEQEILPIEESYLRGLRELDNPWVELPVIKELKQKMHRRKSRDHKLKYLRRYHSPLQAVSEHQGGISHFGEHELSPKWQFDP